MSPLPHLIRHLLNRRPGARGFQLDGRPGVLPHPKKVRTPAVLLLTGAVLVAGGTAPAAGVTPGESHLTGSGHSAGPGAGAASSAGQGADRGAGGGAGQGAARGAEYGQGWDRGAGHGTGRTVDYAAFGDSYAAGYGGGPLLDACGRTAQGYPALLDALNRVELEADATCAGATALTTPADTPVDLPEQVTNALADGTLNRHTDVVTVTIGGNDVRFGAVVAACAGPQLPPGCAPAIEQASTYASTVLAPQLAAQFARIREAAPRATVVVTGYPHLFETGAPGPLGAEAQALFNQGTDALNAVIAGEVPEDGVFVDVVDEFSGHGVGSTDPWIRFEGGPFDLHPTATGYREGYTAAILTDAGEEFRAPGCRGRR